VRHKKYISASVKSVKKSFYKTKSKVKRYEQMLMLSNRSLNRKQGFFDDQYSASSEKYTQKNFIKKNIKFFKNFNNVIKSVGFKKNLKYKNPSKKPIKINSDNVYKF
jgi:protoheme ferro-lyase